MDIVSNLTKAFKDYPSATLNRVWQSLVNVTNGVLEARVGIDYPFAPLWARSQRKLWGVGVVGSAKAQVSGKRRAPFAVYKQGRVRLGDGFGDVAKVLLRVFGGFLFMSTIILYF